jgi:hypothetical protein
MKISLISDAGFANARNIGECKTPFVPASKSTWKQTGPPGARFPLRPHGRGLEAPGRGSLAQGPEASADSPTALASESRLLRCPVAEQKGVPQVGPCASRQRVTYPQSRLTTTY